MRSFARWRVVSRRSQSHYVCSPKIHIKYIVSMFMISLQGGEGREGGMTFIHSRGGEGGRDDCLYINIILICMFN